MSMPLPACLRACLPANLDKLKVCPLLTRSPVCPAATLMPSDAWLPQKIPQVPGNSRGSGISRNDTNSLTVMSCHVTVPEVICLSMRLGRQ